MSKNIIKRDFQYIPYDTSRIDKKILKTCPKFYNYILVKLKNMKEVRPWIC